MIVGHGSPRMTEHYYHEDKMGLAGERRGGRRLWLWCGDDQEVRQLPGNDRISALGDVR